MIKYRSKRMEILVAMAKKGFNQKTLSEASNLNPTTISLLLNNKKTVSGRTAIKIADALETDLEDLFEIEVKGVN